MKKNYVYFSFISCDNLVQSIKIFKKNYNNQIFYTRKFFLYFGIFYISKFDSRNKKFDFLLFILWTIVVHSIKNFDSN